MPDHTQVALNPASSCFVVRLAASPLHTQAKSNETATFHNRWIVSGLCLSLAAVIWLVFGQTMRHEFINCDNDAYLYENPAVTRGFTMQESSGPLPTFMPRTGVPWPGFPICWIVSCMVCMRADIISNSIARVSLFATTAPARLIR